MTSFLIYFLLPFIFLPFILYVQITDYDYFLLVHQWPATFCTLNPCDKLPPVKFTIHGMWPQRYDGTPVDPDFTKKFDKRTMNDRALRDLRVYWPSLKNGSSNMKFWEYEWVKHGSSSATVLNQTQYFSSALNRYRQLNLTHLLFSSGITPGNESHSLDNITDTIFHGSKFIPILRCDNTSPSFLYEIRFCISKSGNNIEECKYRSKSYCRPKSVYLIPMSPTMELVEAQNKININKPYPYSYCVTC